MSEERKSHRLTVRELRLSDIQLVCDYWMKSTDEHLINMGVALSEMPTEKELEEMLKQQLALPINQRKTYALIWCENEIPVGHSNVNKIKYGQEAFMHLHLWGNASRSKGLGSKFVLKSLPLYFNNLKLDNLYCEPFAENEAPSRTLKKIGFVFEKKYRTIPGILNHEQEVNLWRMSKVEFQEIQKQIDLI